ncbi:MAG: T9SS type A sorting domain-containing protein, partial [Candidatus Cloacimonetes bacterium]|nr:T9SS type A sorting domain-containing protein [Candidatus Cloacimonadota bacterium]
EDDELSLLYTLDCSVIDRKNMYYEYPYLYLNNGFNFQVINVLNDFNIEYTHGLYRRNVAEYFVSATSDNFYYITDYDPITYELKIFSAITDDFICDLQFHTPLHNEYTDIFCFVWVIKGDRIYISYHDAEYIHNIEVYQINNQEATLIDHIQTDLYMVLTMSVSNNHIFLGTINPNIVYVYDILEDSLNFNLSFEGRIPYVGSSITNPAYFLTFDNRDVVLRDANNVNDILFTGTSNVSNAVPWYISENYVMLSTDSIRRFYEIDLHINTINQIFTLPAEETMSINNEIITFSTRSNDLTSYYTLYNNQLINIGEMRHPRDTVLTHFYPENNKMVIQAGSGVWVYDFDYTVPDIDKDTPVLTTDLFNCYPNPFNPTTNISFSISKESNVCIDVFNIKGQKVKSLLNEVVKAGKHTIVWDGKDNKDQSVSSGIYLYKMTTGDFSSVKKMVLMK